MNINRNYLTKINFTDKNSTARIKYIVIHYFGGLSPARNLATYWARTYAGASAHYVVGHAGEIFQIVEDDDIAWHTGAKSYKHAECRNSNSIGIEMAVKKISNATMSANDKDWYFTDATVETTIKLTKQLMKKYNIPEENVIRHYDVTGKICPNPYVFNAFKETWQKFKDALVETENTDQYTMIMGKSKATAAQIAAYISKKNLNVAEYADELAQLYIEEGEAEGVRGDVAAAQSCLETGNFTFEGSAVTFDQNNFCGMGVTSNGMKGNSFASKREGIRAQIQHLKAYATEEALKNGCVDPRFKYVQRGCAMFAEWLGQKENPNGKGWAAGEKYGEKILSILNDIIGGAGGGSQIVENYEAEKSLNGYAKIIYKGSDGVNYRSVPDYDAAAAGQAHYGEVFTVVGEVGDFYKLKSGWYLTKRTDLVEFTEKSMKRYAKIIYKGSDGVNYRSVPDYDAAAAGQAHHGEVFTIVGEVGDFYKLKSGYYLTKKPELVHIISAL